MELGESISYRRKCAGLTIDELAAKSGVPKGTLNKIITGITKDPQIETVKAIAKALNCSLDDLDDIKKSPDPEYLESEDDEVQSLVGSLTEFFRKRGYLEENGDISNETLRVMKALVDFLDTYFSSK